MKHFLAILFCCFLLSCDSKRKGNVPYITLINNSQRTLLLFFSDDYPDTSLSKITGCACTPIQPLSKCECLHRLGWNSCNSMGILLFYIWDNDTVNKYGFENCNDRILEKYKFSVNELENINWTITYP